MAENSESMSHTIAIAKPDGTAAREVAARAYHWSAVVPMCDGIVFGQRGAWGPLSDDHLSSKMTYGSRGMVCAAV